ncbi:Fe(3+) dicitrate transport ATP-binding protein FecE [Psychromonas marina]|uniref:Fe(3+) dicitrate transport ATP-binding protein FecE n=1 Tax=Psychromonas marina TaxID=88364 RepID=A0ABQ6DY68_9GAMM|nr:ABC transporter ATP-binding protein [Psychromonas marina]GLS89686.1 Fe(3+) dicitrate transport ATP-binding protein FecE [Psychromonas marina]
MSAPLSCENLTFSFDKKPMFNNINLTFKEGEFVGLIGANGAGKSTLLQLLLGLLKAKSGEVLLHGDSISKLKRREIAKQLAFVPQSIELPYAFTAQQLVAMGRNPYLGAFELEGEADKKLIDKAMRQTDISHLQHRLVNTLSGGEKQRVIIARALAQQSPTILLDEPIASLDICHQLETMQLIQTLTEAGKTAITALHDLNLAARYCDRLILIGKQENGMTGIISDGTPEQVLTDENLKKQFSIQAKIDLQNEKVVLSNILPISS